MESTGRQPRKWSLEEDQKLREEFEAQLGRGEVKDWCRIADSLPGRTNKDCRKRWHNSVAGGLKKGQWSKSEDELLSRGVEQYGQRWTVVANCVETRSADQCAKRWQQSLDPDLDRSEWRESDDNALIAATQRLGRQWKDVQREYFPGRSKNDIKNRYTVLVRRYQNQGITLQNAQSSPSESGTPAPMPSYRGDDDYLSPDPSLYDNLLPTTSHASSSTGRHSWSNFDDETFSPWSSPQGYDMPAAMAGQSSHHATAPMTQYSYTQPPPLGSNAPSVSVPWDQTTPWMQHSLSTMHTQPPVTCASMSNSSVYGYTAYPVTQQPHMGGQNTAYTASTGRPQYPTMQHRSSTHHTPTTSGQQMYDPNASAMYHDSRHPQHPYYPS